GNAFKAVGTELFEIANGGGVAAVLDRLGGNDDLRELIGRVEFEHAAGSVSGAVDLAVGGEGDEGTVDDERIAPFIGGGVGEKSRGVGRAQFAHRLLAGEIGPGGARSTG